MPHNRIFSEPTPNARRKRNVTDTQKRMNEIEERIEVLKREKTREAKIERVLAISKFVHGASEHLFALKEARNEVGKKLEELSVFRKTPRHRELEAHKKMLEGEINRVEKALEKLHEKVSKN